MTRFRGPAPTAAQIMQRDRLNCAKVVALKPRAVSDQPAACHTARILPFTKSRAGG